MNPFRQKVGAFYQSDGSCEFTIWAPDKSRVEVVIYNSDKLVLELQPDESWYWKTTVQHISPGTRYQFRLDGKTDRPDPASVSQPEGVHLSSEIIDRNYNWTDGPWKGLPLSDMVIYELHTGTFTSGGDFEGIQSKLGHLKELGINAIEIMPVAGFPGARNWGYDGVYPYATQHTYGGAYAFKQLIDEAHRTGMAVILDVVYNHVGPDGNYLKDFAAYFTGKYKTPWGEALNFDDAYCDGVRNFFLQNALMWLDEYHIDGLRMDAVHAIWDFSARHFMQELKEEVDKLEAATGKKKVLIAEFDLNNPRYINPVEKGGYNLDGQWTDEFHHALHSVVTGEKNGYYEDFGTLFHLEKAFRNTYIYNGIYSKHRHKLFGAELDGNPYSQFVVFAQNHDHIGNRALGDRLTNTLSYEQLKLVAATVLLSPYVPLLFMGEEYGETNPFLFFVDHPPELAAMVSEGRKKEFSYFDFKDEFPDPQSEESFSKSILSWNYENDSDSSTLLAFYKFLIAFRKTHPAMQSKEREQMIVHAVGNGNLLAFERSGYSQHVLVVLNFGKKTERFLNITTTGFKKIFDSSSEEWNGPGEISTGVLYPNESMVLNSMSAVILEKIPL